MAIARELYHGADVWLNTPRRPHEACGTSGMKAALNGGAQLLDPRRLVGRVASPGNGWAIESAEDDHDIERRDQRECASLFSLLEERVVPLFYERTTAGVPRGWVEMVLESWATLGPKVTASRMVRDYTTALYEPAARQSRSMNGKSDGVAAELAAWRAIVRGAWSSVHITSLDVDTSPVDTGATRSVVATVELDGLTPSDVRVEVLHGIVGPDGEFHSHVTVPLSHVGDGTFRGDVVLQAPGNYGVTARVIPVHPALASPYDLGLATWAQ